IAPLVLEQVAQILIGRDAEEKGPARETGGKLEVGEIGAPVASAQPVLLLGEIVVADAGAMELAQARFGRAEEGALAVRLGDVQRQAVDPSADQCIATSEQERRRNAQVAGNRDRPPPPGGEMAPQAKTPP